jgi:hypothetical protein
MLSRIKTLFVVKQQMMSSTGLKKMGAILETIGSGMRKRFKSGSIVGHITQIYPLSSVRGVISAHCIYIKNLGEIVERMDEK